MPTDLSAAAYLRTLQTQIDDLERLELALQNARTYFGMELRRPTYSSDGLFQAGLVLSKAESDHNLAVAMVVEAKRVHAEALAAETADNILAAEWQDCLKRSEEQRGSIPFVQDAS